MFRCLINCFEAFGGIPDELLFDNMTTVVNINGNKKFLKSSIKSFAKEFGFKVRLCGTRNPEQKLLLESAYYSLLHNILVHFPPEKVESAALINNSNLLNAIIKIVEYIDDNYRNKITLDDLAEISQYNRNYVSQLF